MKSTLIALEPTLEKDTHFDRFCKIVNLFQLKKLLSPGSIVSIMYPSLYVTPLSYYQKMKSMLAHEARNRIKQICSGKFCFTSTHLLQAESSSKESIIAQLSRYGRKAGAELLILMGHTPHKLMQWLLGSFSEMAALKATLPVLIIKPQPSDFSSTVRFIVGVDVATPPSPSAIRWIAEAAQAAKAQVYLVYVSPKKRILVDKLQQRKLHEEAENILKITQNSFQLQGVPTDIVLLSETNSIAQTIADFAEQEKAWLTIVTSPKRSSLRKILLGSQATKICFQTKRPFLDLRLE